MPTGLKKYRREAKREDVGNKKIYSLGTQEKEERQSSQESFTSGHNVPSISW
jgi:hypothetical protein